MSDTLTIGLHYIINMKNQISHNIDCRCFVAMNYLHEMSIHVCNTSALLDTIFVLPYHVSILKSVCIFQDSLQCTKFLYMQFLCNRPAASASERSVMLKVCYLFIPLEYLY